MTATLYYVDGSPFARIVRILAREWSVPMHETLLDFPLPASFFDIAPLGQVPALRLPDGDTLFPTPVIIDHLATCAQHTPRDPQALAACLGFCDSIVAAFYQIWADLQPGDANALGFDPATRNLARVAPFLDWIAPRLSPDDPDAAEFALAAILDWTDSRHPIGWRGNPVVDALVASCTARNSFATTAPAPWSAT